MKLKHVTGISLLDLTLLGLNTLKSVRIECQKTFGKEGIDFFFKDKICHSISDYLILYDVRFSVRHKKWGPLYQELKYEDKCYLHSTQLEISTRNHNEIGA